MLISKEIDTQLQEIIQNEDIPKLRLLIENEREKAIEDPKNNRNNEIDILIASINYNASLILIKFIISFCPYQNLNYYCEYKRTPLYNAIINCNFEVANYLICQGADINLKINNSNLFLDINHSGKMNLKIFYYLINHGCDIDYDAMFNDISNFRNFKDFREIYKYYLFDNDSIIRLLFANRNNEPILSNELSKLMKKSILSKTYEWKNFYDIDREKYEFLIQYDQDLFQDLDKTNHLLYHMKLSEFLDKSVIDLFLDNKNFNLKYFSVYDIIFHIRDDFDVFKYFIDKIFQHKTFNFEYVSLNSLLGKLIMHDFRHNYDDQILYIIDKAFEHETLDFQYVDINSTLFLFSKINYGYRAYISYTFFERAMNHPTFNCKNQRMENFFKIYIRKGFGKDIFKRILDHKTFDLATIDFGNIVYLVLRKKRYYPEVLKYLFEVSFHCPSFTIDKIDIRRIISMFKKKTLFTELSYTTIYQNSIEILKLFIENLYQIESFDPIKNTIEILSALEENPNPSYYRFNKRVIKMDRLNILERKDINKLLLFTINNLFNAIPDNIESNEDKLNYLVENNIINNENLSNYTNILRDNVNC